VDSPIGVKRIQLQGPTQLQTSDGKPCFSADSSCVPCDPLDKSCPYEFGALGLASYCSQSGLRSTKPLPCVLWDAYEAVFPVTGDSPFYVSTRVTEINQTKACVPPVGPTQRCARLWDNEPDSSLGTYYMAGVENFTMLLDHSVRAANMPDVKADSASMTGTLKLCDGSKVKPQMNGDRQDFFKLSELLAAARSDEKCGITLDDMSMAGVNNDNSTIRYDGATLIITIKYSNFDMWSGVSDGISYEYEVSYISGTKSKVVQEIWRKFPGQRTIRNRHGLKFEVLQSGELGKFDLFTLLTACTTSLALLALSTTIVDQVMLRLLPKRELYHEEKYEAFDHSGRHVLRDHSDLGVRYNQLAPDG